MAKYRFATEGKWSTASNWNEVGKETTHKVPGEGDDAVFDATSPKCEITVAAKCRSLDGTLYKNTLKLAATQTLSIGTGTSNGGLCLKLGSEATVSSGGAATIRFVSTSGTVEKISTGGRAVGQVEFEGVGGSWKLEQTFSCANGEGSATQLSLLSGTLDTNGQTVEKVSTFGLGGATTRTMKLGASTIKCAGVSATTTGLTFEAGTSVMEVETSFEGGGLTYATVTMTGVGQITGSNTFATLKINGSTKLTEGTTQTLTTALESTAKSGAELKLESTKAGTAAKLTKASGNVNGLDWLKITDVETNNAVSWFAGANSTLSGLTSFWKKEAESTGSTAQCKTKLSLVGTSATATEAQGQAKGRIVIGDAASVRMQAQAQEKARVELRDSANAVTQARAGCVAQYRFGGQASVTVMTVTQAIARLQFVDAATPNALMQVGARAKVVLADRATASQVQQAVGRARLVFAGHANAVSTAPGAATRRINIFIFEDE